jgi:hypothetical protein
MECLKGVGHVRLPCVPTVTVATTAPSATRCMCAKEALPPSHTAPFYPRHQVMGRDHRAQATKGLRVLCPVTGSENHTNTNTNK